MFSYVELYQFYRNNTRVRTRLAELEEERLRREEEEEMVADGGDEENISPNVPAPAPVDDSDSDEDDALAEFRLSAWYRRQARSPPPRAGRLPLGRLPEGPEEQRRRRRLRRRRHRQEGAQEEGDRRGNS